MSHKEKWTLPEWGRPKELIRAVEVPHGFQVTKLPEGSALGREPLEDKFYIHALSPTQRMRSKPAHREWNETQSTQWRYLHGNDEVRAAVYHRTTLPITRVCQIEDRPFQMVWEAGNEFGKQETKDKLENASQRRSNGKQHNAAKLKSTHRGWLQGVLSDTQLCQTIQEYCVHRLRMNRPYLGDDIEDIAAKSTEDLFGRLQRRKGVLTRTFINQVVDHDAIDWQGSKRALREAPTDRAVPPPLEDAYTGDQIEQADPEDDRNALPVTHREMRVLSHFVNRLENPKHRVVAEMILHGHTSHAIARVLSCRADYVPKLERKMGAKLKEAGLKAMPGTAQC